MNKKQLSVANNMVVSLEYILRLEDGQEIDRADSEEPLEYLQGHGNIIPGLEAALAGLKIGEKKEVVVEPEEAYGAYDENEMETMPRSSFPDDLTLEEGLGLQLRDGNSGKVYEVYVAEFDDKEVVLDFNHPLAGEKLFFAVRVAGLRPATAEEITHGHVHSGHHQH